MFKAVFQQFKFSALTFIFLFFVIRLIGITNSPLEIAHNWRQTTVTMPSRNFLEVDNNILYPQIDFAGELTGITGMEFPLLNYLIYLVASVFGYNHWWGRLINLIVSSLGVWFFGLFVKDKFGEKISLYATIILLVSLWFAYSRKIMPDTFASSLAIIGVYYGTKYLQKPSLKSLLLFGVLTCLALLSKLPVVVVSSVLLYYFFTSKISLLPKLTLVVSSVFIVVPAILWYFYWVPSLVETYGFHHFFMGKSMFIGAQELINDISEVLKKFYFDALSGYAALVMFIYGLFLVVKERRVNVGVPFLISFLFLFLIMLKSGWTFAHHSYYMMPFVPFMAIITAVGIDLVTEKYKYGIVVLLVVVIECVANQWHDFRIKPEMAVIEQLENELDRFSSKEDLIVINSGDYPTPMYFAHRKGWVKSNEQLTKDFLEELKGSGCKYIVVLKKVFGSDKQFDLELLESNENWSIYKL